MLITSTINESNFSLEESYFKLRSYFINHQWNKTKLKQTSKRLQTRRQTKLKQSLEEKITSAL